MALLTLPSSRRSANGGARRTMTVTKVGGHRSPTV
jgi:hypothetical protein